MKKYDCIIIGAGIAGLAIAEFFSRQGKSVVLVEKENTVCSAASADHHGWFHMGSLYSIFWNNDFMRTLIGGVEDLLEYYSNFSRMNIRIDDVGRLKTSSKTKDDWFTNESIDYLLARQNDNDFVFHDDENFLSKLKKLFIRFGWYLHVRKFAARHTKFNEYNWSTPLQNASTYIPYVKFWNRNKGVKKYFPFEDTSLDSATHVCVGGFDVTMRSQKIIKDLVASLNNTGGKILTHHEVQKISSAENGVSVQTVDQKLIADNVIITAGSGLGSLKFENNKKCNIRDMISPLLVVHPPLFEKNFVRMTPFVEKSINHLKHDLNGVEYSVVGGGFQLSKTATAEEISEIECNLIKSTEATFKVDLSNLSHKVYWGNKTEITFDDDSRNYQYHIQSADRGVWIAVPGKFSLAFSLAVNSYKRIYGEIDLLGLKVNEASDSKFEIPMQTHTSIAKEFHGD